MRLSPTLRMVFVGSMLGIVVCVVLLSGWLLLWPIWEEHQMRPAKGTMPNRVSLGTVRVGSTIDASVRVFTDLTDPSGVKASCREPTFVGVRKIYVGGPNEGTARGNVFCDVFLSIRATRAGEHSGTLRVFVGGQKAEIPISINVLPQDSSLPRVLVTETPFDRYSTDDASIFEPLLETVKAANVDIHYAETLPDDLARFDVVLLAGAELCKIDLVKAARLTRFVDEGGRLIVAANHFFQGTVPKANVIVEEYGLVVEDSEPRGTVEAQLGEADTLTTGLRSFTFHRPSPVRVTDANRAKIILGSPDDPDAGFVAISRDKGEVIVLTQSLWWLWAGRDSEGTDNGRLLVNLLRGASRQAKLH